MSSSKRRSLVLGAWALSLSASPALAQAPAPTPAQPAPAPAPAPVAPAPVAPPTTTQPVAPAPAPAPTPGQSFAPTEPAPLTPPEATPPPPPEPAAAPESDPVPPVEPTAEETPLAEPRTVPVPPEEEHLAWYDAIDFRAFADAYFGMNWGFPKPQVGANSVVRAYDVANGFSLSWVGLDASYPAEPVGGTVSLRFGPTADRIAAGCFGELCDSEIGLTNVKQAFASWKPGGASSSVTLDLGKFDTLYGAEVAESQGNINYTRGLLYWFAQPLFHTGLRMRAQFNEIFGLNAMLVNGMNNTFDNNAGKSLGLQGVFTVPRRERYGTSLATVSLGYLIGPERDDIATVSCAEDEHFDASAADGCANDGSGDALLPQDGTVDRSSANTEGLHHLIDLVASITPTDELTILFNGDLNLERVRDPNDPARFVQHEWWGLMAGVRYAITEQFAVAGRGEYVSDHEGFATGFLDYDIGLASGTLTLDYSPSSLLLIRLDNRLDWSTRKIFTNSVRDASGTLITSTLGVVVTTD
jgi:hypothetical protein